MSEAIAMDSKFIRTAGESSNLPRSVVFAIRCIVTFVVIFSTAATLTVFRRELTMAQSALITVIAAAYSAWSLIKSPRLIYGSFDAANAGDPARRATEVWIFVIVQVALAGAAILLTSGTQAVLLLWLLLLPPVSHATILLTRWEVLTVAGSCVAIDAFAMYRTFGWQSLETSAAQFALSLGIVALVTEFMVRAVKARQEAVRLAGELKFAYLRLRESAIQAEEFAASRERNRLAREIHDTIGHALTVVNVQLEVALTMLERDPKTARDAIDKSKLMIQEGLQEIRMSVSELRSSPLDNKSLVEAMQRIIMEIDTMECPVEFEVLGERRNLPQKEHLCLFRAGQEGLTNAKRHSSATRISVILDYRSSDAVTVTVKDNGHGAAMLHEGFGLIGIDERSKEVGGEMTVVTSAEGGFEMTARVPG